jgi:hypothetical protein
MSVLRYSLTRSVAVLSAMIEDQQARWLRGEKIDPSQIATLLNARRREAELIGLDPEPKDVTPSIHAYPARGIAAGGNQTAAIALMPRRPDGRRPLYDRLQPARLAGNTGRVFLCNQAPIMPRVNPHYRRLVYIIAGALCATALMVLAFGLSLRAI